MAWVSGGQTTAALAFMERWKWIWLFTASSSSVCVDACSHISSMIPRKLSFRALSTSKNVPRRVAFHGANPISRTTMNRSKSFTSSSTPAALQRASALASSTSRHGSPISTVRKGCGRFKAQGLRYGNLAGDQTLLEHHLPGSNPASSFICLSLPGFGELLNIDFQCADLSYHTVVGLQSTKQGHGFQVSDYGLQKA